MTQPVTPTIPLSDEPAAPTAELCDVCAHEMSAHDAIARRFCAATSANALTRSCLCGPAA